MIDDDDDLLGDLTPARPKGKPGRKTNEERAARLAAEAAGTAGGKILLPDLAMFYRPVGVKFLADVFRIEQRTVLKKMMKAPVAEYADHKGKQVPRWDFVVAAQHLVDPKIDIESWIKSQRAQDLPHHINDQFWKAMRSKQAWEKEAKQTWRDEDVLEVLGSTAMMIRDVSLLWIEDLPGKVNISTEDYNALRQSVTDLLDEVRAKLCEMPKMRRTESMVRALDQEMAQQDAAALADFDDYEDEE